MNPISAPSPIGRGQLFRSKFFGPGNLCRVTAVRNGNFYYADTITGYRYQAPVDCWEGSQLETIYSGTLIDSLVGAAERAEQRTERK